MTEIAPCLIATTDEQLVDDSLRWCAAVGAVSETAHDLASTRRGWRSASFVIVGDDMAGELARSSLPRRDHVVIVARDPDGWWPAAVELGAVAVCGPREEGRIVEVLSAALDGSGEACIVAVVGGVGGAGASTLTVALALAAHRRNVRPLALDADPLGGGLDLVLGAERDEGLRWDDFAATRGRIDAGSLTDVLPSHDGVSHLVWSRDADRQVPGSWPEVLSAAVRGFDLVAADVPRHLDDVGVEIVGRSVLTLLVVPEDVASVAAARQVLARIHGCAPSVGLVSVGRSGGLGPAAVGDALELPVLARIRPDRQLRGAVDRGRGPGRSRSLRRTACTVLDALGLEGS